jgi:hypothetical protein
MPAASPGDLLAIIGHFLLAIIGLPRVPFFSDTSYNTQMFSLSSRDALAVASVGHLPPSRTKPAKTCRDI